MLTTRVLRQKPLLTSRLADPILKYRVGSRNTFSNALDKEIFDLMADAGDVTPSLNTASSWQEKKKLYPKRRGRAQFSFYDFLSDPTNGTTELYCSSAQSSFLF
jgi:hypothetical protein